MMIKYLATLAAALVIIGVNIAGIGVQTAAAQAPPVVAETRDGVQIDHRIYDGTVEFNNANGNLSITNFRMYNPCKVCQYHFALVGSLRDENGGVLATFTTKRRHIGCDVFNGVRQNYADETHSIFPEFKGKVHRITWTVIAMPNDALDDLLNGVAKVVNFARCMIKVLDGGMYDMPKRPAPRAQPADPFLRPTGGRIDRFGRSQQIP